MLRRLLLLLLVLPLLGASRVIDGQPLADPAPTGEASLRARILFQSNYLAEFEPCSCDDNPVGGLPQGAALLSDLKAASTVPVLLFDAGDRLFRHDLVAFSQEEAARRLKAVLLVDAGNVARLDAAGIGALDLGAGLQYLQKLAQRARYPMLSANLVDHEGTPLFQTSVLLERGDLKVGVTSVLPGDMWFDRYETRDPRAAARAEVKALRQAGAELVVVLSNLGLVEDRRLARASKADLILGSRSREILPEAARVGRTIISHAGSRGRYVGDVRWYGEGGGRGPWLVGTTLPVLASGRSEPAVTALVGTALGRLTDPLLGIEPLRPGDPGHPGTEEER
jgi:2',3'-cyclic-nucleotide 2'-phosphodiesterase (5'-nucleotidase family)